MTRIYQSPSMGDAHLRVALVRDIGQADLLVHRVGSWGLAHGGALWFITRNKQDAQLYIYFCSLGMAQLKVCFVSSYGQAGWVSGEHPLANGVLRHQQRSPHGAGLAGARVMGGKY